ncbi:MAG: ABC transporter permease [Bryobacteraceae bacterium]
MRRTAPRNPIAGFWPVCRKEMIHLSRDRGTVFFAAFIPVVQLVILGFAVDTNVRQLRTVVRDEAATQQTRLLVDRFAASDTFRILGYASSREELYDRIVSGEAKVGIYIPPDYSHRLAEGRLATVQVLVDGSESTATSIAVNTANTILLREAVGSATVSALPVEARPSVLFNPATRSPNFFVPGLIAVLLQMMVILLTALSIVRERERGTLDQLTLTPVKPLGLMLGKMAPYGVLGFLELLFILAIMRWVFAVPIHGSLALLLLSSLPFLLVVMGLGLMISAKANSQAEAFQMSFGTILPSIFLSGYIFAVDSMPLGFRLISKVLPATYFIDVMRGIILRGARFEHLWPHLAILTGMGCLLTVAAAVQFRRRLG